MAFFRSSPVFDYRPGLKTVIIVVVALLNPYWLLVVVLPFIDNIFEAHTVTDRCPISLWDSDRSVLVNNYLRYGQIDRCPQAKKVRTTIHNVVL